MSYIVIYEIHNGNEFSASELQKENFVALQNNEELPKCKCNPYLF